MDASPSTYFQSPQPSGAVVTVVSVERTSDTTAIWTFNTEIAAFDVGEIFGVQVNSGDPEDVISDSTFAIELSFPDTVHVGDPWRITAGFSGITFVGGGTPAPQSGVVIS